MKRYLAMLVLPAYLFGCSGSNPFTPEVTPVVAPVVPGVVTEDTAVTVPAAVANDLTRLVYDPVAMTLTVEGITLDELPFSAVYTRKAALDRPGYEAYTAQDDPLDRHSTAYVAQSRNEGAVRAGVVVTGGPRNRFFGGGYFERDGDYTPPAVTPTTGLVTYAGDYLGLTNLRGDGGDLLAVPAGTPEELIPDQSAEITGDVVFQADFADNSVEGNIFNRVLVDTGTALPSIVLISTAIDANGTFTGTQIEYDQTNFDGTPFPAENVVGSDIGDYAGVFGGTNASGVAGVLHLTQFDGPNDVALGTDAEEEYGVFVLDQCGQPVEDAICAGVNP